MSGGNSVLAAPTYGWSFVQLTGKDVVKFLNNFCTADLKRLQPGHAQELMLLNAKGHVLAWGAALADDEGIVLMLSGQSADAMIKHLDAYLFSEDVRMSNGLARVWLVRAQPSHEKSPSPDVAAPLHKKLCDVLISGAFPNASNSSSSWCMWQASTDVWWLITSDVVELSEVVSESAPWRSAVPNDVNWQSASIADYQRWRIEAGVPVIGQDTTGNTLPQELLRDELAISFTKGCYLGQETVARLDAMGHVNWNLRTLTLDSEWPDDFVANDSSAPVHEVTIRNPQQSLGQLTSVRGNKAIARLRASAVEEFSTKGGADWQLYLNDAPMPQKIVQVS